jgi:hypothetical protein
MDPGPDPAIFHDWPSILLLVPNYINLILIFKSNIISKDIDELKIIYNKKMAGIGVEYNFFCYELLPNKGGLLKFGNSIIRIPELPE